MIKRMVEKNAILPFFMSDYSFRSILTVEKAEEIKDNAPVSIFSIAQQYNLDKIFLVENSFTGFIKSYKLASELKKQLIFGLRLVVVPDMNDKSADSRLNESKVVIFMKNSAAYYDLIKISSLAATEGKYYIPRIDWAHLKQLWTDNLLLVIPFYDSFLHVNLLTTGQVVPDFPSPPVFCVESHDLPFDYLIEGAVSDYAKENKNEIINVHQCYYFRDFDVKAYQVYRCIMQRTTLNMPEIEHFSSEKFSFESYLRLIGKRI